MLHYQVQSTLQYPVLANTWRINCSIDAEPAQLHLALSMPDKHFYHSSSLVLQSKFWHWIASTAGPTFWHYFAGKSRQVLFKHVSVYFFDLLWHFKKSCRMRLPNTSIKILYKYNIAQKYIKFLNTIMYMLTFSWREMSHESYIPLITCYRKVQNMPQYLIDGSKENNSGWTNPYMSCLDFCMRRVG